MCFLYVAVGGLEFSVSLVQQAVTLNQAPEELCSFSCTCYLMLEELIC